MNCSVRLLSFFTLLLASAAITNAQSHDILVDDAFENRKTLGSGYITAMGTEDSWTIRDGVLYGVQTRDDHGAVLKKPLKFDNLSLQFDFRFNGGTRFNVVIDDKQEKSVHAGHICRVSITPDRIIVGDDKVGLMNLKVREMRQNKDLSAQQKKELAELLKRTQSVAKVDLKQNSWHSLQVRIQSDVMTVYLDRKQVAQLTSPGIDHPTKTHFGFTVMGDSVDFDNLIVVNADVTNEDVTDK